MSVELHRPGVCWWKFDFHTHTPASVGCYLGGDADMQREVTPESWLLAFMRVGIDCVAVTDHHSGDWIDSLKLELAKLGARKHPDYRPLHLFPGTEIRTSGVHVLAIFDPSRDASDIDRLLEAVGYQGVKGGDECTQSSILDVLAAIGDADGRAIPAHVDRENGLFQVDAGTQKPPMDAGTLQLVLNYPHLIAMEVRDPSAPKPQFYIDSGAQWTEVVGSDTHGHAHETEYIPGNAYTWVKMGDPGIENLRLALLDGPLSLRRTI